jgi:hypothetical protein
MSATVFEAAVAWRPTLVEMLSSLIQPQRCGLGRRRASSLLQLLTGLRGRSRNSAPGRGDLDPLHEITPHLFRDIVIAGRLNRRDDGLA